jgi:hypothetical protein
MILCRPTVPAGFPVPAIRNACRVPSAYRVTVVRRLRDMSRVGRKLDAWRIFPELGLVRLEASRGLNGDFKSSSHPPAALNPAETGSSSSLSAICCFARSRARMHAQFRAVGACVAAHVLLRLKENGARLISLLSFEDVPQSFERTHPIADDLHDGQHRNGQDRAWYAPHPEPEHQRQDDQHGVYGEAPRKQHGSQRFPLDEMDPEIERRR